MLFLNKCKYIIPKGLVYEGVLKNIRGKKSDEIGSKILEEFFGIKYQHRISTHVVHVLKNIVTGATK